MRKIGVRPILKNAVNYGCCSRPRIFFTNIPQHLMETPKNILQVEDIIEQKKGERT